jgi:DNA polymerase-3 subunit epsilon
VISALGTLAVAALVWLRSTNHGPPLEALSAELRTRAWGGHGAARPSPRGIWGSRPAAAALAIVAGVRGEADRVVAEATARLAAEQEQLSAILSEIPLAVMALGPDHGSCSTTGSAWTSWGPVAPLGLGRPVTDYLAPGPLDRAVAALAGARPSWTRSSTRRTACVA